MNNKKGFTLVELLGVIVIIGVLALIAIPTVQTMIKKSKQSAYNNLLTTIKLAMTNWENDNKEIIIPQGKSIYLTISQLKSENYLDNQLINPLTDEMVSNDMLLKITNSANGYTYEVMESTGSKTENYATATPKLVLSDGLVRTIKIGDTYNASSLITYKLDGSNNTLSISPTELNGKTMDTSVAGEYYFKYNVTIDGVLLSIVQTVFVMPKGSYENGTIVYFNPETALKCLESEAVSTTGTKTGCMKWYVFNNNDASSNVNLILDHNTTNKVIWNSANNTSMNEVLTQLNSDTATWNSEIKRKVRLIRAGEIAQITGNTSFVENTTPSTGGFYFDSNTTTASTTCASGNITGCKYGWLYDRTSTTCVNNGCSNNADNSVAVYSYWTSTSVAGSSEYVWRVSSTGNLAFDYASMMTPGTGGVRPVITVSKSIIK